MPFSHLMPRFPIFVMLMVLPCFAEPTAPPVSKPATVLPVTQDRDKAVYDWAARHQAVMELGKQGPVDVVMLGDSILHYWAGAPKAPIVRGEASWNELFQEKKVVNLGFGWDRVENALWRVQNGELKELKPAKVILLIGTNNLQLNSAGEIRMGIEALCQAIHKQLPQTSIHVIGILPRTLPANILARPAEVNQQLHQHLAGMPRVHFYDMSAVFLDEEKKLNSKLFSDGLHPNEAGYQRLAQALRPIVVK